MPHIFSSKLFSSGLGKVAKLYFDKIEEKLNVFEKELAEYICILNNRPFKPHNYK